MFLNTKELGDVVQDRIVQLTLSQAAVEVRLFLLDLLANAASIKLREGSNVSSKLNRGGRGGQVCAHCERRTDPASAEKRSRNRALHPQQTVQGGGAISLFDEFSHVSISPCIAPDRRLMTLAGLSRPCTWSGSQVLSDCFAGAAFRSYDRNVEDVETVWSVFWFVASLARF